MPSTIVVTAKSASANSYVTVNECSTYFDDRLNATAWREASEDDKTRALLSAAERMNHLNWRGGKTTSAQALAWPRIGVVKRDSVGFGTGDNYGLISTRSGYGIYGSGYGEMFDADTVPDVIKDAQCELALALLTGWQDGEGSRVKKYTQDGLSVEKEFAQPLGALPAKVLHLIGPYLQGAQRVRA